MAQAVIVAVDDSDLVSFSFCSGFALFDSLRVCRCGGKPAAQSSVVFALRRRL